MLAIPALVALLPIAAAADVRTVPGEVHDAVVAPAAGRDAVWVTRTLDGRRELVPLLADGGVGETLRVPSDVVSVDGCAPFGLVFQDARGLRDAAGKRLLEGRPLLARPDPEALFAADLCHDGELRLAVADGVFVRAKDGSLQRLRFLARARAYSGRVHRGLRPRRPYGMALSLYAPRLIDADVNGDGLDDLICVHESRVKVFLRGKDGRLSQKGRERDLARELSAPGDDVRVLAGDTDGDGKAELYVGVTAGAVPERSVAFRFTSGARPFDGAPKRLWDKKGLVAPLSASRRGLVVGWVDTSMVALGAALLTGEVPLTVTRGDGPELALTAVVDVRKGRMAGSLPVTVLDLDRDGTEDLIDLGLPGRAAVHPGTARGWLEEPVAEHKIPNFIHAVPLPGVRTLALIGEPGLARDRSSRAARYLPRTQVTLITGSAGRKATRRAPAGADFRLR